MRALSTAAGEQSEAGLLTGCECRCAPVLQLVTTAPGPAPAWEIGQHTVSKFHPASAGC